MNTSKTKQTISEKMKNPKEAFRNEDGAIDLASIMVGIIVIGLIGGVIAATVFAVIPWAQDNAAKQQLDSVVAAQSAYMGLASSVPPGTPAGHTPNSYADSTKLEEAKLMSKGADYCTIVTEVGKGYEAFAKSDSGKIWTVTDKNTKPAELAASKTLPADCSFITSPSSDSIPAANTFSALTISAQAGSPTANNGDGNYYDIDSSDDGSTLIAVSTIGYVFKSTDYGVTWNPILSIPTPSGNWQGAAISADGKRMVVARWNGLIYTSSDSGATWIAPSGMGTANWRDVAISRDGNHIVVGEDYNLMYYSHDFGATWKAVPGIVQKWRSFAVSDNGQTMIGVSIYHNYFWMSKDGGLTWVKSDAFAPQSSYAYSGASISADGKTILVGQGGYLDTGGVLQTSTDGGTTWTTANVQTDIYRGTAMSADGTKMIVVGQKGNTTNPVYTSVDSGKTWQQQTTNTAVWYAATMSNDGSKIAFTSISGQKIHTGEWK